MDNIADRTKYEEKKNPFYHMIIYFSGQDPRFISLSNMSPILGEDRLFHVSDWLTLPQGPGSWLKCLYKISLAFLDEHKIPWHH